MPRNPRKHQARRRKGYRKFIGPIEKGRKQYGCKKRPRVLAVSTQQVTVCSSISPKAGDQVALVGVQKDAKQKHLQLPDILEGDSNPSPVIENLYLQENSFLGFDVPPSRNPIRCLSLFDGISTGLVALDRLGILVSEYFSSEIDQDAIAIQKKRFPLRVTRIGCVTQLDEKKLDEMGPFDLLIGGSPCEDLSRVNPRRRLFGENSTGLLFFDFIRILNYLSECADRSGRNFYYLYENTTNLDASTKQTMIENFGAKPVTLCSSLLVPMRRPRLFFTNIPQNNEVLKQINVPPLEDYIDVGKAATTEQLPTITTNSNSHKKKNQFPVVDDGVPSVLSVNELERLFGFGEGFTDNGVLSTTRRRKLLGKSWVVPVIAHLLQPLQNLQFSSKNYVTAQQEI